MKATKHFEDGKIFVYLTRTSTSSTYVLAFDSEDEMRRAGQCLIDLARIGGKTVEIKDKKEKE